MAIYYEPWAPGYGSSYEVRQDEEDEGSGQLLEDGETLCFHDCLPRSMDGVRLALTDGVRRIDGWLYSHDESTGEVVHGAAGTYAVGAVLFDGAARARFDHIAVERVVVWGSGLADPLPQTRSGYSWRVISRPEREPEVPMVGLQNAMRDREKVIAESLCDQGWIVVADGTLYEMRTRDRTVVGYVKTHHRRMLGPEDHRRVPELHPGQRTSLFRLHEDRLSCYLRLQDAAPFEGPWHAIVRLEVPAFAGLEAAVAAVDRVASLLPRYAGIRWRDPRAPQNLQPIGALETHLRHLLGSQELTARAVRQAVATSQQEPKDSTGSQS